MKTRINYTSFETLGDYYKYMAYECRKLNEFSQPNRLINWWQVGYAYRKTPC